MRAERCDAMRCDAIRCGEMCNSSSTPPYHPHLCFRLQLTPRAEHYERYTPRAAGMLALSVAASGVPSLEFAR